MRADADSAIAHCGLSRDAPRNPALLANLKGGVLATSPSLARPRRLAPAMINRPKAMRGKGESYSDVIVRLVELEGRV